jgi:hypothetical protein
MNMAKTMWTDEQIFQLIEMEDRGVSRHVIAKKIGYTVKQCGEKVRRMRQGQDRIPAPDTSKMRKCLGPDCQEEFLSRHVGERVCPTCKATPEWRHGHVGMA